MERSPLTEELIVADVLDRWPQTIPVFIRHRMACVGCTMAPFETLAEATAIYGMSTDRFVHELREVIQPLEGTA